MAISNKLIWLSIFASYILFILSSANQNYSEENADDDESGDDELIFTQIVYRHGNRTPVLSYPNDPYYNRKYFPEGFGVLTDDGKELQFNLGRYFRNRYRSLLGTSFSPDKVYVRSSGESRAVESAEYNTAGLLLPCGNQSWKGFKKEQIIPIHTMPFDEENLLYPITCARADKIQEEYLNSNEIQQLFQKYSVLRKYVEENIGSQITTLIEWVYLYDALLVENERGLILPYWAQYLLKTSYNVLMYFKAVYLGSYTPTTEARKIRSGFLLKEILDRFRNKTMCLLNPEQVMYIYSGHDASISFLLNGLKVFDFNDVSFGASLLFELHRSGCEYYVQIFYRNSNTKYHPVISIPNCGTKCPLYRMYELYRDILPTGGESFESLCQM